MSIKDYKNLIKSLYLLILIQEQKWDSHFINDQIPDLYAKKKKPKPQGKTLSKLANDKRSMTPLNYKNTGNTVGSIASKK